MKKCLNCDIEVAGTYCSNCGQKNSIGRLSFHSILHDLQHSLIHLDKGVFKNFRTIIEPSKILDYINGKRIGYFNPIVLLLIVCGAMVYVEHHFQLEVLDKLEERRDNPTKTYQIGYVIGQLYLTYSKYLEAMMVLPLGLWAMVFYKKETQYNFVENIYIQTFIVTNVSIISILTYPILRYSNPVASLNIFIVLVIVYFVYRVYDVLNWVTRLLKSVCVVVLGYLTYMLVFGLIAYCIISIKQL